MGKEFLSNAEQLLYSAVKLEVATQDGNDVQGTGCLIRFELQNGKNAVALVSCRHVLEGASSVKLSINLENEHGKPSGKFCYCNFDIEDGVSYHPDENIDLAGFIFHHVERRIQFNLFYLPISEEYIPSGNFWANISVGDRVLVPGFPWGLEGDLDRTPFMRSGVISNRLHGNIDECFAIELSNMDGASGSPVIMDSFFSFDKINGSYNLTPRFLFLGIFVSGLTNDPSTPLTHLGKVVKSDQLHRLLKQILIDTDNRDIKPPA